MAAHNIQTKRDFVKTLQYVGEGDSVSTPSLYGVTPTDPTFIAVGKVTDLNLQPDIQHQDSDVLGNEDIIDAVKTGELHAFQISFEMRDTALIDYAFSPSGGGTGSIDESLSFMFSEYLNGVENWTVMRGCRPTSCTCTLNMGVWEASMTFIAQDITVPSATDPWTAETETLATEPATAAMSHSGAGADPFTHNAIIYPESRFSTTVTRGMGVQKVNGIDTIVYCKASTRRVEFSVDALIKTNVLETDYTSKVERLSQYKISTSPDKAFLFVNAVITSHSRQKTASNADAFRESITARCGSVTIGAAA